MSADTPDEPDDRVKIISEPQSIPVYNCEVIISRLDNGEIHGQVSNLDGIEAMAVTERELLQDIVKQFKASIAKFVAADQEIPWLEPPRKAASDQVERQIAVHL